jgi:hypothetical protein
LAGPLSNQQPQPITPFSTIRTSWPSSSAIYTQLIPDLHPEETWLQEGYNCEILPLFANLSGILLSIAFGYLWIPFYH